MPVGLNFWGHSVLFLRLLDRYPRLPANNPNRYGTRFVNSWDVTWGEADDMSGEPGGLYRASRAFLDQSFQDACILDVEAA